jgi:hypothetical protein
MSLTLPGIPIAEPHIGLRQLQVEKKGPVVERPVMERPVMKRPVMKRPVMERPVMERPVTREERPWIPPPEWISWKPW